MELQIKHKFDLLEFNKKMDPIRATYPDGTKHYMERIIGSIKIVSNMRKVIHTVSFANTYYHDGKIPQDHIAVENMLLKIDLTVSMDEPERYLEILDLPNPVPVGTQFYLDGELYMANVSFLHSDEIRDELLHERAKGERWFEVLRIVDASGNVTEFYASPAVRAKNLDKVLLSAA